MYATKYLKCQIFLASFVLETWILGEIMSVKLSRSFVLASFVLLLIVTLGCQFPAAGEKKGVSLDGIMHDKMWK